MLPLDSFIKHLKYARIVPRTAQNPFFNFDGPNSRSAKQTSPKVKALQFLESHTLEKYWHWNIPANFYGLIWLKVHQTFYQNKIVR